MSYDPNNEKMGILMSAAQERRKNCLHYQINIDNFRMALNKIEEEGLKEPHMVSFADNLRELLKSSQEEQDKEKIMLYVIEQQILVSQCT